MTVQQSQSQCALFCLLHVWISLYIGWSDVAAICGHNTISTLCILLLEQRIPFLQVGYLRSAFWTESFAKYNQTTSCIQCTFSAVKPSNFYVGPPLYLATFRLLVYNYIVWWSMFLTSRLLCISTALDYNEIPVYWIIQLYLHHFDSITWKIFSVTCAAKLKDSQITLRTNSQVKK